MSKVRKSGLELRKRRRTELLQRREREFPADVGFAARAVVMWPWVEVVSSHWVSSCHKTQNIFQEVELQTAFYQSVSKA